MHRLKIVTHVYMKLWVTDNLVLFLYHSCIYICIYIFMYICMCVYMYVYKIHIYISLVEKQYLLLWNDECFWHTWPFIDKHDLIYIVMQTLKLDQFCWIARAFPTLMKVNLENSQSSKQLTSSIYMKHFF